jgi:replicative superfamily II helicase
LHFPKDTIDCREHERLAKTRNGTHLKELLVAKHTSNAAEEDKSVVVANVQEKVGEARSSSSYTTEQEEETLVSPRKSTRVRPKRPISTTTTTLQSETRIKQDSKKRQAELALKDPTLLTHVHFAEQTDLHPNSKRALKEVMGLTSMTEIQQKTFHAASSGRDVLGRARTGTGKTLAYLLPALERVLSSDGEYQVGRNVGILILSPTRELATQIANVAEQLLTFHKDDFSVQVVYGGTKMARDVNQLKRTLPTILVATPGRLKDHLLSTVIHGRKFGADIMKSTPVVVLDETDRLFSTGHCTDSHVSAEKETDIAILGNHAPSTPKDYGGNHEA